MKRRVPRVGDKVTPVGKGGRPGYPNGTVGRVVDAISGAAGLIVVCEFPGYHSRVDLYWKKVRVVAR